MVLDSDFKKLDLGLDVCYFHFICYLIVLYTNLQVTAIANLAVGREVKAEARSSGVYSDSNFQTSMMGFLYSPASQSGIAWAVYSSGVWRGPIDPIPWDAVIVNQGEIINVNVIPI